METKRNALDRIIILLSFILVVFHTFTFLQIYYNFKVTLGLFAIILFLYVLSHGTTELFNNKFQIPLFFLVISTIFVIGVGIVFKEESVTKMIGAYFPYVMWAMLYVMIVPLMTESEKKKYVFCFLITFAVSVIATLMVVATNNEIARLLAGTLIDEDTRYEYYRKGVGGYGFVYGCVFTLYGIIYFISKVESKILKLLLWVVAITTLIMVLYASYTLALIISLVAIALSIYANVRKKISNFSFVMTILIGVVVLPIFIILIHNVATVLELEWVVKRTGQLLDMRTISDFFDLRRVQLYRQSIECFFKNPLLGDGEVGGHSMVLDDFGKYGLFGGAFEISVILWINKLRKEISFKRGLIYALVIFLVFVNTVDTIVMYPMILFVLPLILSIKTEGEENESRYSDTLLQK